VLRQAARLAYESGAQLTIVRPLWTEYGKSTAPLCDPQTRKREIAFAQMRMERLRRRLAPAADIRVEVGMPEPVLCRVLEELRADLLVTSRGDLGHLPCPAWRVARSSWGAQPEQEPTMVFAIQA
jgi:hypothetical protein